MSFGFVLHMRTKTLIEKKKPVTLLNTKRVYVEQLECLCKSRASSIHVSI